MGEGSREVTRYSEVFRRSIADPEGFWGDVARELHWYREWDRVLDNADPLFSRWFVGGQTNLCYNAVDRHVLAGLGDKVALIWESTAQGRTETITYRELHRRVNRFAGVLSNIGVAKGDRVAIYLPMVPEAVVAMLACVRIGAIHVVVFTGFGVDALAGRIADAAPKVLITADAVLRRNRALPLKDTVDKSLEKAPVETVIVVDRGLSSVTMKEGRDYDWADLLRQKGKEYVEPVAMESREPSNILYTSGQNPGLLGVVRDTGGYMVALYNSMKQVFDVRAEDVYWTTADIGWVVGHSYVVYGPLLLGITSVLFEGTPDYPDHGVWWRVVEKHRVSIMFSSPTAMKMLRRFGIEHKRKCDTSKLRYLFLAGELLDESTWRWASEAVDGRPVVDNYWTTESGWPMVANMPGIELLPTKPGSAGKPVVGYDIAVVDDEGNPVSAHTSGHLVVRPPLPPGNIITLWRDDERYRREYWRQFPGEVFATGDLAVADDDGYLTLLGRADDVLNVAAHRLGMSEIEEVIASHPAVAEVCVIGAADVIKGEEPVAVIVLAPGREGSTELKLEIRNLVRERIGAVATPRGIRFVPMLPKTADGRCMKKVLRALYEKRDLADVTEDGASADEVEEAVRQMKRVLEHAAD